MRSRCPLRSPFVLLPALLFAAGCEEVTVTVLEVTQVEVQPAQRELVVGEALHLTVVVRDHSGNLLQDRPVGWSTGDPSVAQVSADGVVLAQAPGVVPIKASVAGVEGMASIRVLSPAQIVVASQLHFVGQAGQPNPPAQLLPITNSGEAPLTELSLAILPVGDGPSDWLRADLQLSEGGMAALLNADLAGLPPGSYAARLRISSSHADNSPVDVTVELHLQEPVPSIQLSASTLGFPWKPGQPPPPTVTVDVWNGGAGVLGELELSKRYEAGQPSGWLDARLLANSAPTEIEVAATPGSLPEGTYTAWIALASPDATNSPRELRVRLTVGDPVPQIVLNPDQLELFGVAGETSVRAALARVEDANDGPLSGLSAVIEYPPGGPAGWLTTSLAQSVAPTDLTVQASAAGLAVGTYEAVVRVEAGAALNSPRFLPVVFHVYNPVSAAQSVIESSPDTLTADGTSTSTITVRLRDPGGTPLSSGGHQVHLSTTAGHLGPVVDLLNGTYQATLTATTTIGVATVTGQLDGNALGAGATVTFVAGAASAEHSTLSVQALEALEALQLSGPTPSEVKSFRVEAQLRDRWDNPLRRGGDQVSFSSSHGDIGPVEDHDDGTYSAILSISGDVESFTVTGDVNGTEMADNETVEPPPADDPPADDPPADDPPGDDPPDDDPPGDDPPADDPPDDNPPADDPPDDDPPGDDPPGGDPPAVDPTIASVSEISYLTTGGPDSTRHIRGSLSVVDGLGDPLPSASVAIELANQNTGQTWSFSGVSDNEGRMLFQLNNVPDGCYVTRVVSLTAPGYTWDGDTPPNQTCRAASNTLAEPSPTP
jgi:hypothetical protein